MQSDAAPATPPGAKTEADVASPAGALANVRVLDLTTLYPGPLATMLLADLGADVIRVDAPDRDDLLRWMPPHDQSGQGALWRTVGRGKRTISLDLKQPAGREALLRLVKRADVLVEQFRPGVLDRLGIGWSVLHEVNPRLVLASISAFGQTGPDARRAGHDINFLARSGVSWHLGRRGQGPMPLGVLVGDVGGGTWPAVTGILAALLQRGQTGLGQRVDVAMADGALWMNAMAITRALAADEDAPPEGSWLDGGSFYDYYRCADGRHLAVGALEPKFFATFLAAIGRPDLEGLYLADGDDGATLKAGIAQAIAAAPLAQWVDLLRPLDCCVEPVQTPREAAADPQLRARGMIVAVPAEGALGTAAPTVWQIGCPVQLSAAPACMSFVGREPGADTRTVLAEVGYDDDAIDALLASAAASGR